MVCVAIKIALGILFLLYFCFAVYPALRELNKKFSSDRAGGFGSNNMAAEERVQNRGRVSFSVLSWNIWFGSRGGWDQPEKRWSHLLEIVIGKDPDVIGFQECTQAFLRVVKNAKDFTEKYTNANSAADSRYFVMIYVKKTLKTKEARTIPLKTHLERQCESVTIQKGKMLFKFGTVHVESYVTADFIREIQLKTIFDELTKKPSSAMELAFVVGDFNFDETAKENVVIDEGVFNDTWSVVHPNEKGATFENVLNLMNKHALKVDEGVKKTQLDRLDRILFWDVRKSGWKATECEILGTKPLGEIEMIGEDNVKLFPSDHFGLFATFERECVASEHNCRLQ